MYKSVSKFMRWVSSWPVLVVLGLNVENFATDRGLSRLITYYWSGAGPMMAGAYAVVSSPWILYPAIFLAGAVVYEWLYYWSRSREQKNKAHRWKITRARAANVRYAFRGHGFNRRIIQRHNLWEIHEMNDRLYHFGLPELPDDFSSPEYVNRAFAQYLQMVAEDEHELARSFHDTVIAPMRAAEGGPAATPA